MRIGIGLYWNSLWCLGMGGGNTFLGVTMYSNTTLPLKQLFISTAAYLLKKVFKLLTFYERKCLIKRYIFFNQIYLDHAPSQRCYQHFPSTLVPTPIWIRPLFHRSCILETSRNHPVAHRSETLSLTVKAPWCKSCRTLLTSQQHVFKNYRVMPH